MTPPTTATGYGLIVGALLILAGVLLMTWLRSAAAERRDRFVAEVKALTKDNVALAAELDELHGRLQDLLDTTPLPWDETGDGLAAVQLEADMQASLDIAAHTVALPGRRLLSVPTQRDGGAL